MKQIDIIRTYSQKRCLVVDDMPETRTSLKRILIDYGAVDVDTAGHAEDAIELCQKKHFDIVVSDYNLGAAKNGQQLLEELRHQKLLKNSSLFILITAESNIYQVLHALEFEPDDYMSKPVNRESLRPRLDQALLKNEALHGIKSAIDENKPTKAIAECRKILDSKSKYQNDTRKILGSLCVKQGLFDDAENTYSLICEQRRPIWAELGLAKVYYGREEFDRAEQALLSITNEHPYCVEAQDLLAKLYERTFKLQQAQEALARAVKISPNSTPRQRELGRISLSLDDENMAVHAYKNAIKHGRKSYHESANDQINLAQGLCNLSQNNDGIDAKKLRIEAMDALKVVKKKQSNHPITAMRGKLVEADIHSRSGNNTLATSNVEEALNIHHEMRYSVIANTSTQICIDCAKAFMDVGEYDAGEKILQELSEVNQDPDFALKIDTLLREPKTPGGMAYAGKLNKQGINYYAAKDLERAIPAFINVLRTLPNHIGLNLNLIQALVSKHKGCKLDDNELLVLHHCFLRIGNIQKGSSYYDRYHYLDTRFQKIKLEQNGK